MQLIELDFFSMLEPGIFKPLVRSLLDGRDHYMLTWPTCEATSNARTREHGLP